MGVTKLGTTESGASQSSDQGIAESVLSAKSKFDDGLPSQSVQSLSRAGLRCRPTDETRAFKIGTELTWSAARNQSQGPWPPCHAHVVRVRFFINRAGQDAKHAHFSSFARNVELRRKRSVHKKTVHFGRNLE